MKAVRLAGACTALALALGGCATDGEEPVPTDPPATMAAIPTTAASPAPDTTATNLPLPGAKATRVGLTVQVTGSCADDGGFRLASSGFTPNGAYLTKAWYPDGTPYAHLIDGGKGTAGADGSTPGWTWDCNEGANGQPDPPGIYRLMMIDTPTKRWVKARFEVRY